MIPYRIETLFQRTPWMNWLIGGATIANSVALWMRPDEEAAGRYFVLGEGSAWGLLGHLGAHGDLLHLAGNMIFLWVFGNAVCATIGNLAYLGTYLFFGVTAGLIHLLVDGQPAIGASGAISGVVAMAVALYPINRVSLAFFAGWWARSFRAPLWAVALYWTGWDLVGAWLDLGGVAYWAHLGGTASGLAGGLILLGLRRVTLTEFDNASLLDVLLRRTPPHLLPPGASPAPILPVTAFNAAPAGPRPVVVHPPAAATVEAPRPVIRLKRGEPPPPDAAPGGDPRPFFYFDGTMRHGPLSRRDFEVQIASAADLSRWWYWAEGMAEWQRVPARSAIPPAPSGWSPGPARGHDQAPGRPGTA